MIWQRKHTFPPVQCNLLSSECSSGIFGLQYKLRSKPVLQYSGRARTRVNAQCRSIFVTKSRITELRSVGMKTNSDNL